MISRTLTITVLDLNGAVGDSLDTYGFDWSRDYEAWDFYVQYAAQAGDNNANVDYDGTLWNLAVGYDLDEDDKLGLSWTSFSGNEADSAAKNEAWVNLAGDGHKFLGFADVFAQSNIEDIAFTWDRQVNARNSFHLAYHMFSLENTDGALPTLTNALGASGLDAWAGFATGANANAGTEDDLGNELDLVWKHQLSNDVSLALGYAAFDAGDYFTANNAGANSPDVTYSWINANVKF